MNKEVERGAVLEYWIGTKAAAEAIRRREAVNFIFVSISMLLVD
jgi:hypothetical protein